MARIQQCDEVEAADALVLGFYLPHVPAGDVWDLAALCRRRYLVPVPDPQRLGWLASLLTRWGPDPVRDMLLPDLDDVLARWFTLSPAERLQKAARLTGREGVEVC